MAALLPALVLVCGCANKSGQAPASPRANATPSPKNTPPPITAKTSAVNALLFDASGNRVAMLEAAAASYNPSDDQNIVTVRDGKATLYEKGQTAATLTASTVTANRKARTVTGVGNVVAHSLTQKGAPTIRADKMVWHHETQVIDGSGNVVITAEPDYRLYGDAFTADTKMRKFSVQFGNAPPATGSL